MRKLFLLAILLCVPALAQNQPKIAVVGLVHSHVWGHIGKMLKGEPARLVGVSDPHADLVAEVRKEAAKLNVQAMVTERVGPDTVWMPFHFSGRWQGADLLAYYPAGAAPVVRGEAVNTATTYGYDSVTMMQETKTTICNVQRA